MPARLQMAGPGVEQCFFTECFQIFWFKCCRDQRRPNRAGRDGVDADFFPASSFASERVKFKIAAFVQA